ncbi:MAG: O-succinylhomoserine sulfhydrylase [Caulobacteraceae bacterium]|nr:O-succinylhomoserine sulfhydrylase [Caulobacteraceae bacterium]
MTDDPESWKPATRLIRGGLMRSAFGETAEALYLTQGYVYDTAASADARFAGDQPGFVYSRYANPTVQMFEERLALLEGTPGKVCRATASGMAAVHAALVGLLKAGDHLVAGRALFGSCRWIIAELLPRFGVETTLVDATDLEAWKAAIRPNTKVAFVESPANPLLEITDIAAVAKIVHGVGARLVVDNVFATPIFQKPFELGADVVVYSATKHIDGGGRVLGGAIIADPQIFEDHYKDFLRHTGPTLSAFNAWVMLKSMETLDLRVRAQSATAARLADQIADHAKCVRIFYPGRADHPQAAVAKKQMSGFSNLIAFDLGSRETAWRFLDSLNLIDISNNLGDAKSMATHPSTTTHRSTPEDQRLAIGLTEGCVRLSVGLEDGDDLSADIARALDLA